MAKGQKRSGREPKKPKAEKPKAATLAGNQKKAKFSVNTPKAGK